MFNDRTCSTRIPLPLNQENLEEHKAIKSNDKSTKQKIKQKVDTKAYVKKIQISQGDLVLCRQLK